jgi:SAM-dependent methyltransferase
MADGAANVGVPLSHLPADEKAKRAASFGAAASHYERFRPGPTAEVVDWILPRHAGTVVDLGAGTGALTRLLIDRADDVVAVEPDDRMRAVLTVEVPGARAVTGRGESIPLPDASADAVLASSSWHWMDLIPTLHEVGRVLVPGGTLGAVWSGPDPDGAFIAQARAVLAGQSSQGGDDASGDGGDISELVMPDVDRPLPTLEIPAGVPFDQPEHRVFLWEVALNADDLIGLLGTFSWILTMADDARERVLSEARRLLRDVLGVEGDVTVDIAFRADAFRARRHA